MSVMSIGRSVAVSFCAAIVTILAVQQVFAGWSPKTHRNYIVEAIRILPYFDYLWCSYYRDDLLKGAIEGEFHFRHYAKGRVPRWMVEEVSTREASLANGYGLTEEKVTPAARFLGLRFEKLRNDLRTASRPNSEIMFDLGYWLHSLVNVVVPRLTGQGMPSPEPYARSTASIDIRQSRIDAFSEPRPWLEKRLRLHLESRNQWEAAQSAEDFERCAAQVSEDMIYSLASVMAYVLDDSFGPEAEEQRAALQAMQERRLGDGRKPDIE
jgi:hypothetical protein